MNQVAIQFTNISVTPRGHSILTQVNAHVPRGSTTAIVGPNGAGKTTLLRALLQQIPHEGTITIAPMQEGRSPRIGYVPQRLTMDWDLPITVTEFMVLGWQRIPLWFGVGKRHRHKAALLLESVRAEKLAERRLGALSGGEMQRVMLALALGQDPDILILDEPASGVDVGGGQVFCEILEQAAQERELTQLMVSHDLATVIHHANHVICLNKHVVAEGSPCEVLTPDTLTSLFGIHRGLADLSRLPENPCGKGGKSE